MARLIFLLALAACQPPEDYLREKGRPEPIVCKRTGRDQQTCVDGKRVVWVCGTGDTKPTCMATGVLPAEIP